MSSSGHVADLLREASVGVEWLECDTERPGADRHRSYASQNSTRRAGEKVVKRTVVRYETRIMPSQQAPPLVLVIKFPEDMKRERVKFTMTAVDLF